MGEIQCILIFAILGFFGTTEGAEIQQEHKVDPKHVENISIALICVILIATLLLCIALSISLSKRDTQQFRTIQKLRKDLRKCRKDLQDEKDRYRTRVAEAARRIRNSLKKIREKDDAVEECNRHLETLEKGESSSLHWFKIFKRDYVNWHFLPSYCLVVLSTVVIVISQFKDYAANCTFFDGLLYTFASAGFPSSSGAIQVILSWINKINPRSRTLFMISLASIILLLFISQTVMDIAKVPLEKSGNGSWSNYIIEKLKSGSILVFGVLICDVTSVQVDSVQYGSLAVSIFFFLPLTALPAARSLIQWNDIPDHVLNTAVALCTFLAVLISHLQQ